MKLEAERFPLGSRWHFLQNQVGPPLDTCKRIIWSGRYKISVSNQNALESYPSTLVIADGWYFHSIRYKWWCWCDVTLVGCFSCDCVAGRHKKQRWPSIIVTDATSRIYFPFLKTTDNLLTKWIKKIFGIKKSCNHYLHHQIWCIGIILRQLW